MASARSLQLGLRTVSRSSRSPTAGTSFGLTLIGLKSHKQISYWETGERQPGRDSLNKLAFLYRCSAGVLLGGEDYSHLDPAATTGPAACNSCPCHWPLWSALKRCYWCAVAITLRECCGDGRPAWSSLVAIRPTSR